MSVINLFSAARNAISEWRRREKAYGELMALDDRSLADIGIHRSQIGAAIAGFPVATPAAKPHPVPNTPSGGARLAVADRRVARL